MTAPHGAIGRRERQLIEIFALFANGARTKATGLAAEHVLEFPADADVLDGVLEGAE